MTGDGAVYLTGKGALHAFDSADGKVRWKAAIEGRLRLRSRPTVTGGNIYIEDRGGFLHAFASGTGKSWKQQLATTEDAREFVDLYGMSPLAVTGLVVVYDHGGHLLALDQGTGELTGGRAWKAVFEPAAGACPEGLAHRPEPQRPLLPGRLGQVPPRGVDRLDRQLCHGRR